MKWVWWALAALVGLLVVGGGFLWWRKKRATDAAIGPEQVDSAFDQAAPPTNIDLETPGEDLPNTTDLMNDFNSGGNYENTNEESNFDADFEATPQPPASRK